MRTDDPIATVLQDQEHTTNKAIKAERSFVTLAKYAFEKEFGPYRDKPSQCDAFLAGVRLGSGLIRTATDNEFIGREARSIENGFRGVIVDAYREGNDEDGYQTMFTVYKDTDDCQRLAHDDVVVYP